MKHSITDNCGEKYYPVELWKVLTELCRGEPEILARRMQDANGSTLKFILPLLFWIIAGSGIYGMSIGIWRAPLLAAFVSIKFPLLILFTTLGNGMLNAIIAQLLGAKMTFKNSLLAVLMSFSIASIILGALAPLTFFLVWNAPVMGSENTRFAHILIILSDVAVIAFAGIVANLHLFRLLVHLNKSRSIGVKIIFSWLLGNLLLGGQLSWIMRPFIGTPSAPVEFFRNNPFDGNFFEAVFRIIINILNSS
jgi:hypothetical protein